MNIPATFLIMEDDELDYRLFQRAVDQTDNQHPIIHFPTGIELLDYLAEWVPGSPYIAAILLDMKMPAISGLEVLARIRASDKTRFLPVIMLTASSFPGDLDKAYAIGANAFVQKSMDRNEFQQAIHHLLGFWGKVNLQSFQQH